ncbi:MAG: quinone-dependent dihydroorotate dehydrogenase [Alphaproteobacteria bacterium]
MASSVADSVSGLSFEVNIAGISFPNPIGLAAGYDKNANAVRGAFALGFGFVEVGTVTPLAQEGNSLPRLFRLRRDEALINRLGFNNEGIASVVSRLRKLRAYEELRGPLGVNLGPGRDQIEEADTALGEMAHMVSPYADYVTINLSSPNTPGLREMQTRSRAESVLRSVGHGIASSSSPEVSIFLKLSSDISEEDLSGAVSLAREGLCRALIIGNTTTGRPSGLREASLAVEKGGLSGRPLFGLSTGVLARAWQLGGGEVPLVGVGGVDSVESAWQKIRHGASVVQLYTGLVYQGPGLVRRILRGLEERMRREGYSNLSEVTGSAL